MVIEIIYVKVNSKYFLDNCNSWKNQRVSIEIVKAHLPKARIAAPMRQIKGLPSTSRKGSPFKILDRGKEFGENFSSTPCFVEALIQTVTQRWDPLEFHRSHHDDGTDQNRLQHRSAGENLPRVRRA